MKNKRGFTLIELLVVIAIIAILAAILFPVFAKARRSARNAVCLSNTKQVALGMQMYANDYDETWALSCGMDARPCMTDANGQGYWNSFNDNFNSIDWPNLQAYLGGKVTVVNNGTTASPVLVALSSIAVARCPEDTGKGIWDKYVRYKSFRTVFSSYTQKGYFHGAVSSDSPKTPLDVSNGAVPVDEWPWSFTQAGITDVGTPETNRMKGGGLGSQARFTNVAKCNLFLDDDFYHVDPSDMVGINATPHGMVIAYQDGHVKLSSGVDYYCSTWSLAMDVPYAVIERNNQSTLMGIAATQCGDERMTVSSRWCPPGAW